MSSLALSPQKWLSASSAALLLGAIGGLAIALIPNSEGPLLVGVLVLGVFSVIEPVSAVLILLVAAPLKALIATEAPALLPLDIGQVLLAFAFGSWLVNRVGSRRRLAIPLSGLQAAMVLFVFAASLSLADASSISKGFAELLKWLEMIALITLCLAVFDCWNVQWLVVALVAAAAVQGITGLYQFFGGSGAEHLRILDGDHFRAFGTFGQPNPYGAFLGITLPLAGMSAYAYALELFKVLRAAQWDTLNVRPIVSRIAGLVFYGVSAAVIAGGLLASWSRGAWMGVVGAVAVVAFFIPRTLTRSVALVLAVTTILGLAWTQGLIPSAIASRVVNSVSELVGVTDVRGAYVTDENYAIVERIAHWQAAGWMARDHPWTGVGIGNYEVVYPEYALMEWQNPLGHAHNYYLNLLAEVGVVGLVAYLVMWLVIAVATIRMSMRTSGIERAWCIGLLGTWAYLSIHSLVDNLYVNNMFMHVGCMIALLAVLQRQSEERTA